MGTHGIYITFPPPTSSSSTSPRLFTATYLPEVAQSQGWSLTETLDSLIRKAGFKGPITRDLYESIDLTRYQSSKVEVTYPEFLAWRGLA